MRKAGFRHSEETIRKIRESNLKTWSNPALLEKQRLDKLGDKNPAKRQTVRKSISATLAGNSNAAGHVVTTTMRELISKNTRIAMARPEVRLKLLEQPMRKGKMFNTKPEIRMGECLSRLGYTFLTQKRVSNITRSDHYLTMYDIHIFCDGDYWHNREDIIEKDRRAEALMKVANITYLRFWEHEILQPGFEKILDKAIRAFKKTNDARV